MTSAKDAVSIPNAFFYLIFNLLFDRCLWFCFKLILNFVDFYIVKSKLGYIFAPA